MRKLRRKKPSQFRQGAYNALFGPGLRREYELAYRITNDEYFQFTAWPTEQMCPTCKGHCDVYCGRDYHTSEVITEACYACDGTGVMLWMRPSSKQHERNIAKWFDEVMLSFKSAEL